MFKFIMKYWVILILSVGVLGLVGSYASTLFSVAKAPAEIIKKTFTADNILHNYEWFYDVNAQFVARSTQVTSHKELLSDSSIPTNEKTRLRIELSGMKQVCRNLAVEYNANSAKMNRSLFKSNNLPHTLDINVCN